MTSPTKVGLVLSGGGTKLFTHIGLLEALDDAGLLNERVSCVVGTSAGSIAGSLYALGYAPQEAWKLLYWRAWGYDPPDDGRCWRGDTRPRPLSQFIDLDFETMGRAITRNISYFKGFDSGKRIEEKLRKYLDWQRRERDGEFLGTLPPERRKPLYIVALNISNRRQAIFHFEAHCRPLEVVVARAPAPGREVHYEYYHDVEFLDRPLEEQLQVWEAVRCSACLPTVFQPYLKRNLTVDIQDEAGRQRVTQTAYYTDGGARDNYSLSTAIKLDGCEAVFGHYLGQPGYPFQVLGHSTVVDVVLRDTDAMMQALYEADQDDGEICARPVRTINPIVHVRSDVTFDISDMGGLKEAGYIGAAYYLWQCSPGSGDREFFEALLDGQVELDWETVFRPDRVTWGEPARGRRVTAPLDSHYYIIRPTEAFAEMGHLVFEERYPAPRAVSAALGVRRSDLQEELERRNRERREIEPGELDHPIFQGSLQRAQKTIVKGGGLLAWFSVTGIVAYVLTALWVGLSLLVGPVAAILPLSLWAFLPGQVVILVVALIVGWFGHRWVARTIWQRIQGLIARSIGIEATGQ